MSRIFGRRLAIGLASALLVIGALGAVYSWQAGRPSPARFAAPDLRSPSEQRIAALQAWLQAHPEDTEMLGALGSAYLQQARETGDPAYYPRAEQAFTAALRQDPHDPAGLAGMGSLSLSRHRFREGLAWGEQARAIAPRNAAVLGVIVDGLVETGQYARAVQTAQALVDLKPNLDSYARVSYLRELHGYTPDAIDAMHQAVRAGAPGTESLAWAQVQLGGLYFSTGNLTAAQEQYQAALQNVPDYVHALAGMGRVQAARGYYPQAIAFYRRATARTPIPQYVIELGEVEDAAGDHAAAEKQYTLLDAMRTLYAANGVDTDLELALFDLDHDRDVAGALARIQAEREQRPSLKADDTLAWGLFKRGDCAAAQAASTRAMRLGWQEPLLYFHAGLIADCLGQHDRARELLGRAVALNPHFSVLYGARAQERLAQLGGPPASTTASAAGGAS